mgnify:CR=1 FL=1
MKVKSVPCREVRYREFPELLFGKSSEEDATYFDATSYILSKGNSHRHNIQDFRIRFHHWIEAAAKAYGIDGESLVVRDEATGHVLIDECLALLFVAYIDPEFGVYMLERVSELLSVGFAVSDTWLVQNAGLRFSKQEIINLLND